MATPHHHPSLHHRTSHNPRPTLHPTNAPPPNLRRRNRQRRSISTLHPLSLSLFPLLLELSLPLQLQLQFHSQPIFRSTNPSPVIIPSRRAAPRHNSQNPREPHPRTRDNRLRNRSHVFFPPRLHQSSLSNRRPKDEMGSGVFSYGV